MNLVLIGYRATGKTTLARHLAQRLGWDWIDADVEIEHRAGKSIARIFAEQGEPAFRDLEAEVIADLCGRAPRAGRLVVAAGGGAPLREESRRAMRNSGQVVWLTATPETILARMTGDATTADRRPSLTNRPPREEIVQLLGRREPIYRESAHLIVDTEGKSPEQLADEILAGLKLLPKRDLYPFHPDRSPTGDPVRAGLLSRRGDQSRHLPIGLEFAADQPLVAAAPRRPAAAVLGSAAGYRLAGAQAGSQLARRRLLDPADVAGVADRGRVRASVLVGGRPLRPGAAQPSIHFCGDARLIRHPRSWRRSPFPPSGTSSSSPTWFCSASCSWLSGSTSTI